MKTGMRESDEKRVVSMNSALGCTHRVSVKQGRNYYYTGLL